jgi:hypothetical protein
MFVNDRDQHVLLTLARYGFLSRRLVQQLFFPQSDDGREARRCLARLVQKNLIRRHSALVASVHDGALAPVFLLTAEGREYLALETGDDSFLYKPIELPHPLQLVHAMAVVEFHITFDAAIATQTAVAVEVSLNEGDVINAADPDPAKHYRLHTKLSDKPKVSCSPDAAFLLDHEGRRSAFYLEMERGDGKHGTGSRQLVERKCPGYAEVAKRKIHLNHFPAAGIDGFHVLLVAPSGQRRDAIRRAFQQKDAAVFRTDLWRFAAHTEVGPDALLTTEMWYPCSPGPAERLPAIGAVARPGAAADREKIERDRAATANREAGGGLAGDAGQSSPGDEGSIAEAAGREVVMLEQRPSEGFREGDR